jgi:cephalosporin hydroxylase
MTYKVQKTLEAAENNLLEKLAVQYCTDKQIGIPKKTTKIRHGYTSVYNKLFSYNRLQVTNVLEIGVQRGGSLQMWSDYFPSAIIDGIDIVKYSVPEDREETIRLYTGDGTDKQFLEQTTHGKMYDIIVDDGSHNMKDQQMTFKYLFEKVKQGGFYIIEDCKVYRNPKSWDPDKPDIKHTTPIFVESFIDNPKDFYSEYLSDDEKTQIAEMYKAIMLSNNLVIFHRTSGEFGI